MLYGSLESLLRVGRENVAVFPVPVYELIMTLLPEMIDGMARDWIYVGLLYLIFWHNFTTHGDRLIDPNVTVLITCSYFSNDIFIIIFSLIYIINSIIIINSLHIYTTIYI